MKIKLSITLVLFSFITVKIAICQSIYKSKYNYSINIPKDFTQKAIIGKNVDFKISDSTGNTVVIVVKKLPVDNLFKSAYDLEQITYKQWEDGLSEGLPNPKIVKSGKTYLDNIEAFFIHYTTTEYDNSIVYYYINYQVIIDKEQYVIPATCLKKELNQVMPVFYKIIQSIKFE